MEVVKLSLRKTHRFVGTYRHEDKWVGNIQVKMTSGKLIEQPGDDEDYCEPMTVRRFFRAPAGVDIDLVIRMVESTMSRWGCHHEYDCCGCRSYSTRAKHIGNRRIVVTTRSSRNF